MRGRPQPRSTTRSRTSGRSGKVWEPPPGRPIPPPPHPNPLPRGERGPEGNSSARPSLVRAGFERPSSQSRTNWLPGTRLMSLRISRTLSVAITCEAVRPVLPMSSSTAFGRSSSGAEERPLQVAERQLGRVADGRARRRGWTSRTSGPSSSRMSSTVSTSRAPSRIRRWQPRLERLSTGPGTAKTSRFCSIAWWAVTSEPLRGAASTTTTPRQRPEMIRLRCGNSSGERPLTHRHLGHDAPRRRRPPRPARRAREDRSPTGRWPGRRSSGRRPSRPRGAPRRRSPGPGPRRP